LSFGPWARYYILMGDKLAFFGDANVGFGMSRNKQRTPNGNVSSPGYGEREIAIGPGCTYFITKNVGIEGLLQFKAQRTSYHNNIYDQKQINTTSGLYFNVGLQIYL
jgi:hypothetical protein